MADQETHVDFHCFEFIDNRNYADLSYSFASHLAQQIFSS
jgi:hypothetical protein